MFRTREAIGLFSHGGEKPDAHRKTIHSQGFGQTNAKDNPSARKDRVKKHNRPERVIHNFFNSDGVQIKYKVQDEQESEISVHRPTNPYGPVDTLIVASDKTMRPEEMTEETLRGRFIYEMTPQAQQQYWSAALATLKAAEEAPHPEGRFKSKANLHAVIMENTTPLSYIDANHLDERGTSPATSRTIYLPHLHVTVLDGNWMVDNQWELDHLNVEQTFIQGMQQTPEGLRFFETVIGGITRQLSEEGIVTQPHTAKMEPGSPIGYSLSFPGINAKNVMEHTDYISAFLNAHFTSYKDAADVLTQQVKEKLGVSVPDAKESEAHAEIGQDTEAAPMRKTISNVETSASIDKEGEISHDPRFIPQPSFRDYIYFDKKTGQLTIRIAPAVFSSAGVAEAAGIEMVRGPEYTNPIPPEKVEGYRRGWIRKVARLTRPRRESTTEMTQATYKKERVAENGRLTRRWTNSTFTKPEMD